jgi:glycosyltransferase involved in cell wall biosynthesis
MHAATCDSPLVSVILPTFNRASMLPESIASVLNQTERNLELIVVDDGSSDTTGEVISRFARQDDRITHVRQNNLGLPKSLNNGFRIARGEFFTWTSDDNRYFPEALVIMSGYLRGHSEVGLVYAEMLWRTSDGLLHLPAPDPNDFWRQNTFGGAFLYRRSVARDVGEYDPSLTMVEDYDFFLRTSYRTIVHHLPYVVYEFRKHSGSLTSSRAIDQIVALEKLVRRHQQFGKAKPWQISRLAATVARSYRSTGRYKDALRLAWLAWRLWPFAFQSYRSLGLALSYGVLRPQTDNR